MTYTIHLPDLEYEMNALDFMSTDKRQSLATFDEAILAQLHSVLIGVTDSGPEPAHLLIDLNVWISFKLGSQAYDDHGMIFVPTNAGRLSAPQVRGVDYSDAFLVERWRSVSTSIKRVLTRNYDEALESFVGEAFTLRLLFDGAGKRETCTRADILCDKFAHWDHATTSLREAMFAIRSTLLEPLPTKVGCTQMHYRSAAICNGWNRRVIDPTHYLKCGTLEDRPGEPTLPSELTRLFAARAAAVWSEAAQVWHAPEPQDEVPPIEREELAESADAADDYVCADRMLSLWYGSKRRRRYLGSWADDR